MKKIFLSLILALLYFIIPAHTLMAQEEVFHVGDEQEQQVWRAEVVQILDEQEEDLAGMGITTFIQSVQLRFTNGPRIGETVVISNDYIRLEARDDIFVARRFTFEGEEYFSIIERDRSMSLLFIVILFALTIILIGGKKGFRSLLSLVGSLLLIAYVLIPLLVRGYSPLLVSIVIATFILFFVIIFTYGFNKRSYVALGGTVGAVVLTGLLSILATKLTKLSGFASDESVYLNVATGGELNFVGLLLGAIIIGVLGVLDDVAITQVSVVNELYKTDLSLTKKQVYKKALNVGKDHVGSMVNTLALAYTGAALPLLLLLSQSQESFLLIINKEVFTTEIVRTLVGSIGLVLTVPLTTLLAVYFLKNKK